MEEDVAKLTRRMVACDENAWRTFHERYFPYLTAQAIARGISRADAPELVQGVYLRVLRHAKVFLHANDFEAWLCCLTRCEAIDASRRIRRRTWLGERFQQWQESRRIEVRLESGDLESAMQTLDEDDRRLLTRHYLEGWSQQEIADDQCMTTKAVESKLARLRQRLRREMENLNTCGT